MTTRPWFHRQLPVRLRPLQTSDVVQGHWFALVPESEAKKRRAEGRPLIPESVHESRIFRFKRGMDRYTLTGISRERFSAFVVPIRTAVTQQTGSRFEVDEAPGLQVATIDLAVPQPDLSPTVRIDAEAVARFAHG